MSLLAKFSDAFDFATGQIDRFLGTEKLNSGAFGVSLDCPTISLLTVMFPGSVLCSLLSYRVIPRSYKRNKSQFPGSLAYFS